MNAPATIDDATRPAADALLTEIADYVIDTPIDSDEAYDTAHWCLLDSLGCAMLALTYPACVSRLGPIVPGATLPGGARVPGTSHELEPVRAAFNTGAMIRWLDYNDTWLAAEWGHPSDNLGAILALADYLDRQRAAAQQPRITVRDVLTAAIKAHEIQGVLALENAFNRVGLDHVLLVRVASTAVATAMLGGDRDQVVSALSNAWLDGGALRTYRHAPNTGPRKSWAAGDATARGLSHALMALAGEMGYPTAMSAKQSGVHDVLMKGEPIRLAQPLGSYVMEHVLFKVLYPAEFHAQTAVEAAQQLHPRVRDRLDEVARIDIHTQEAAVRSINKTGPLHNPADRDHCLQYMVAIPLIHGHLDAAHYEDDAAADPRIDALREKMHVAEDPDYSRDYLDPSKRSIANRVQVRFTDGSATDPVEIAYPIGHRRRRAEATPLLWEKFKRNMATRFKDDALQAICETCSDPATLASTPIDDLMQSMVVRDGEV